MVSMVDGFDGLGRSPFPARVRRSDIGNLFLCSNAWIITFFFLPCMMRNIVCLKSAESDGSDVFTGYSKM